MRQAERTRQNLEGLSTAGRIQLFMVLPVTEDPLAVVLSRAARERWI
jgi:hypothetical protein